MKRAALLALAALLLLGTVLVGRALIPAARAVEVPPGLELEGELDPVALSRRLGAALRVPTISSADPAAFPHDELARLVELMEGQFPRLHAALRREQVGRHALLYLLEGRERALAPALLLAHLDVVPVEADAQEVWTHPPFGGEVAEGFVWGRGALDDKGAAWALLEALELHLRRGERPRRDVLVALGFDEEVGGGRGARAVAELLGERGVRPLFVLDEGLAVLEGLVPGVAAPVAAIGIAEKGFATVELSARGAGGHSSMPGAGTVVGRVARAVERLERHPLPAAIDGPTRLFLEGLRPHVGFGRRLVLSNLWLFAPLVERELARAAGTDALLRTTTAATRIAGGGRTNVLPRSASATVDFRVHPHDTVAGVLEHVRATIDDELVQVSLVDSGEAPPVAPAAGEAWELLERAIRQVFPRAVVVPALLNARTDSLHYVALTRRIYRFMPLRLRPGDLERIHGVDERIAVADYLAAVRFYAQLLHEL